MSDPLIGHTPPPTFPAMHYIGLAIPMDFAEVVKAAALKANICFADQLLMWTQKGAECSRLHREKK